ncbi:hypothetical protein BJ508DRAFT_410295 [Ascobolus immersus RN42]|uniref:Granulins domain-containing protein n=1 Tax=Ascobolus immersus RN42 TaxID=1160509 RepID=A0A3N4IS13_ASCIM|nr:hypothetical protein BJ508DRAFT_410295 [Ascobolus immersus RN42]
MQLQLVLLSLLPVLASATQDEAPVRYKYGISIAPRTLFRRQFDECPSGGYTKCLGDFCCQPGTVCDGDACCPTGLVCTLPATCVSRSDPDCASSEDCCPTERPYCTVNNLGGAVCGELPSAGGGIIGGDIDEEDEEDVPPAFTPTVPTTTRLGAPPWTPPQSIDMPITTEGTSSSTRTTPTSSSSSGSDIGDLFDSFTSSVDDVATSVRSQLPTFTDNGLRSGGPDEEVGQSSAVKNNVGMAVVAGLGMVAGGVLVML